MTKPAIDTNARMLRAFAQAPAPTAGAATIHRVYAEAETQREAELDGSIMTLNVEDVHTYDKDPRTGPNPLYAEIKASLIAQGNNHRFSVTRRPGDSRYFINAGGNTRLKIIKELWRETGDKRWKTVDVVYRTYKNESSVILAHLAENDVRSEISFWQRAAALADLKAELEAERGEEVLVPDLVAPLKAAGMNRGVKSVQTALFAVESLRPVGPWLEFKVTQEVLAPAYRALVKLGVELGASTADVLSELHDVQVEVAEILTNQAREAESPATITLDADNLIARWHRAISVLLKVDPARIRPMVEAQTASPRISADSLRAIARGEGVSLPTSRTELAPPPSVSAPSPAAPSTAARAPVPAPAEQMPLRPALLSPVTPAGMGSVPRDQASSDDALEMPEDVPAHLAEHGSAGLAQHHFFESLKALSKLAELDGDVLSHLHMPLGYLMEPPVDGFAISATGETAKDPNLRRSVWLFLAALSGQYDQRAIARLDNLDINIVDLAKTNRTGYYLRTILATEHDPWPTPNAVFSPFVHDVLLHPQVGPACLRLLSWAHKLQAEVPERTLGRLTELLPQ